jgi:hypothetical protein
MSLVSGALRVSEEERSIAKCGGSIRAAENIPRKITSPSINSSLVIL